MNSPILSIIVPIYNVEIYIENCINSILKDSHNNFELILVIDGSPDNSLSICKKYEEIDKRVIILEKENGGLSDARNAGIKVSKGKYIWFVDGDDYIEDGCIEVFIQKINKAADIFLFNYQEVYGDKIKEIKKFDTEEIISANQLIKKYNNYGIQAWTQIYSRDLLLNNNIFFLNGVLYEDVLFNTKVYSKNPTIQVVKNIFVNYLQRDGSIMNSKKSFKNIYSIIKIIELFTSNEITNFLPHKFIIERQHYYFTCFFNFLKNSCLNESERIKILNEFSLKKVNLHRRESDSFVIKCLKNRFPNNSVCIYKNWNLIFLLIRFDNFRDKKLIL